MNIPSFIDDFALKPPFIESFALLKIFVARDVGRIGALASGGVFGPGLGWSKKVAVATHTGLANGFGQWGIHWISCFNRENHHRPMSFKGYPSLRHSDEIHIVLLSVKSQFCLTSNHCCAITILLPDLWFLGGSLAALEVEAFTVSTGASALELEVDMKFLEIWLEIWASGGSRGGGPFNHGGRLWGFHQQSRGVFSKELVDFFNLPASQSYQSYPLCCFEMAWYLWAQLPPRTGRWQWP